MIDVNALIGPYPFRHVPHPDPEVLVRVLDREGITSAWVGHLPSAFYRDPTAGKSGARVAARSVFDRLHAVPTIRPDWPLWDRAVNVAAAAGAPAIRAYPPQWGMGPHDGAMRELALAVGERGMALVLTVRFEDLRQRHAMDTAGDLSAAAIRALARAGASVRLVVTAASREMIEEVHWSLTADEQRRVFWDISWIWGPPEDHLAKLFRTDRRGAIRLRDALAVASDANAFSESGFAAGRSAGRVPRRCANDLRGGRELWFGEEKVMAPARGLRSPAD
jgi:hypothetical protein